VMRIYGKLEEYKIRRDDVRVVATSAVREASNRLAFLDRLYIATGFDIEPFADSTSSRSTNRNCTAWPTWRSSRRSRWFPN